MLAALLLTGCATGDRLREDLQAQQRAFERYDWGQLVEGATDGLVPPSRYARAEEDGEKQLCLHDNAEERVVFQEGIDDAVGYRRCPVTLYPVAGGRLDGRGR